MAQRTRTSTRPSSKKAGTVKAAKPAPKKAARQRTASKARVKQRKQQAALAPPRVLHVIEELSALQARMMSARNRGLTIGFVPTMGALHDGHAALLDEARRRADIVVCSIFVNPKQFAAGEDLARYPRDLETDRRLCNACGVDVLFAPQLDAIYPPGFDTRVVAGALGAALEGEARPGHFDGVLTVVSLLIHLVQPHFAVFGEKDYQQLTLVRRLVRDLKMPIEIVAMPVIRAVDGLALSSRNAFLGEADRRTATCLYRALMAGQDAAQRGAKDTRKIVQAAQAVLDQAPGFETSYVEVRDARTMQPVDMLQRDARLLIAGRLGGVRLIDNGPLFVGVRYDG